MAVSKSAEAIMWMLQDPERTQSEAAAKFGIHKSVMSRAWAKREQSGCCPACGQTLKQGKKPGRGAESSD